ncbi:CG4250, partial [Drosophila busckii]
PTALGNCPSWANCPSCQSSVLTKVTFEPNSRTHLMSLLMFLAGCICCFCAPYWVDSCQSAVHHCGKCGIYLGTYKN